MRKKYSPQYRMMETRSSATERRKSAVTTTKIRTQTEAMVCQSSSEVWRGMESGLGGKGRGQMWGHDAHSRQTSLQHAWTRQQLTRASQNPNCFDAIKSQRTRWEVLESL